MSWWRSLFAPARREDPDADAKHAARQAQLEAEADRHMAKQRWADVDRVTDEFAAAVERALRGTKR